MSHPTDADNEQLQPANAKARYTVRPEDLPLSCPTPEMALWNSHPRVYLPVEKSGREACPYCGAEFILEIPAKD